MDPVIRNVRDIFDGTNAARLINLDDKPPTCTLTYSEIPPGGTSAHHIHEWEHEVYIIEGELQDTRINQTFTIGMSACRPPGMHHGPYSSPIGCTTFEVRYYRR